MTNNHTNSTIVGYIVCLWIKERWLQNSCWEIQTIEQRMIECIYSLWRARHHCLVNRLTPMFTQVSRTCFLTYTNEVFNHILILSDVDKLLKVFPCIRITHINMHSMQFLQSLLLGYITHPCIFLQTILESLLQVLNQLNNTLLATLWEILLHIQFTYCFTQTRTDCTHGTFPTWLLFLNTWNNLLCLKATISKIVRQIIRIRVNNL